MAEMFLHPCENEFEVILLRGLMASWQDTDIVLLLRRQARQLVAATA